MNLSNLNVGFVVKNYKMMCKLLGEKEKSGKSKKYQQNDWKRYFDFEKEGQKYIITKIFETPLSKEDLRSLGNNSIYLPHIELILLNYLSAMEENCLKIPLKKLLLLLGLVNNKYNNRDDNSIMEEYDISEFQINHFYQRTYQKLRQTVFSSLKSLKARSLIMYEEIIVITKEYEYEYELHEETRKANDDERRIIMKVRREILKEMELESIIQVFLKFKQNDFFDRVDEELYKRYKIKHNHTEIEIIFNNDDIIEAKERAEIEMQKRMLNDKMFNAVNKQAEDIVYKNNKKMSEFILEEYDKTAGKPKFFIMNEDIYLYSQHKLAELLIKY